jgi:pimeloyl-ACP methyl ester carboxylesterase
MSFFDDPVHENFAEMAIGYSPYGAADYGELQAIVSQVEPADDGSFFDAFSAFARRRIAEADAAVAKGHDATARECYLRAAQLLSIAFHPLFGKPLDPRLVEAFHLQVDAFDKAMAIGEPPAQKVNVPYESTTLPAYFVRAPGHEKETRPTILVGGGWDSSYVDNYHGIGAAALRRGYHVLLHDGPGQGRLLIDEGLPLRYDWEKVVGPVLDAALKIEEVDADRIAYQPWSLGGYMAPRVAAFEPRLAALVCDPGQMDVWTKVVAGLAKAGLSDAALARLPEIAPDDEAMLMKVIDGNRMLHWQIVQRGFWANGATDLSSFLAEMSKWKLDAGTVARIRCPTLVTSAEGDRASTDSRQLFDALTCPKQFVHFTSADGAAQHCEQLNRSFANRVILDWLDDTFDAGK